MVLHTGTRLRFQLGVAGFIYLTVSSTRLTRNQPPFHAELASLLQAQHCLDPLRASSEAIIDLTDLYRVYTEAANLVGLQGFLEELRSFSLAAQLPKANISWDTDYTIQCT